MGRKTLPHLLPDMTKKNAEVQEFRSSGVQESSELGTN
jgi:hypothetical protein